VLTLCAAAMWRWHIVTRKLGKGKPDCWWWGSLRHRCRSFALSGFEGPWRSQYFRKRF
jgi:hypothetical protein